MRAWKWICDDCGAAGIHFSKEAAEAAAAAHPCYGNGGWLPEGTAQAVNATGQPEPVK